MTDIYLSVRLTICSFLFLIFSTSATAQLQAGFTTDKVGGCSPLTVSFTNTTTGASATAIYKWDFGNTNTSALPEAAATYIQEQAYNVTLTVIDAGKSSSATKQVSVYKRPMVDFTFDTKKGCLPLAVNFAASAIHGVDSITKYFWDFGDGNTQQTTSAQIQHTYNLSQQTVVGLSVVTNHGCYNSVEKTAVQVMPGIHAAFSVNDTFLCRITDAVAFTNASTGPGTLNYRWDFGDGSTSNAEHPGHVFDKKGVYDVKLTVANNEGCSNSVTQTNFINVANFAPAFNVPQPICLNTLTTFRDVSSSGSTNKEWFIDGVNVTGNFYDTAFHYLFQTTGEHIVHLTADYDKCKVADTQKIFVNGLPDIKPFIVDTNYCKLPATINFKDTTKDAVAWTWVIDAIGYNYIFGTSQSPSYESFYPLNSGIFLTVKNAAGCEASERQYVNIDNVYGFIKEVSRSGCDSVTLGYKAILNKTSIVSYKWDFGDSTPVSQLPEPFHTYKKTGNYNITLQYITDKGCGGTITYTDVHIFTKPKADFIVPGGNTICGNTPTKFVSTSTGDFWTAMWSIAKSGSTDFETIGFDSEQFLQFPDTGYYNIRLIVLSADASICNDTITKLNIVKVLPAVPKIGLSLNTCDNPRGLMKFTENSIDATTWIWDFGDSTSLTYHTRQDTILHNYTYTNSTFFKVRLTAINGACSVTDSVYVSALLKQNPILSLSSGQVCSNGNVKITLGNYESNPSIYWTSYQDNYELVKFQYGDGSTFTGHVNRVDSTGISYLWYYQLTATLSDFDPLQTSIRAISSSTNFGCNDTSNYVPIKINGAKADFTVSGNSCFEYPVLLQDVSKTSTGSSIVSWNWDFGDSTSVTNTSTGSQSHVYQAPGLYTVLLKVTDNSGCTDTVSRFTNPTGPKAAFGYSPANVTPNIPVSFTNNTNLFNSTNTQYQWIFGDGKYSTVFEPSHHYAATGIYTVQLVSTNPVTMCQDTATQVINVKLINTEFSFSKSYVSTSTCPPVIVHFTNTSLNAQRVSWDFGDGSIADNQNNPSHTYYTPGTYKITMNGFGHNGTRDTTVDSIVVRAPFATLKADNLSGCSSQSITLSAAVTNASYITWDFADGTIQQTQDTFAVHSYATPGLYNPSLILLDSGGCYLTAKLADTIIIDALTVALPANKNYCGAASVSFNPTIKSVAAELFGQPLSYHWNFGTGNPADTANIPRPTFNYNTPGKYFVSLLVQSPYGCSKLAIDSIMVAKGSAASVTGPADICRGVSTQFTGQASNNIPGISWKWDFGNGATATQQNPSAIAFTNPGDYRITLVVENAGCADTALHLLTVHGNPVINAGPQQAVLCLGKSIPLYAGGGNNYAWSPPTGLDNSSIASPVASPLVSTRYLVRVTDSFGCFNTDSVNVTVAQPFSIQVSGDTAICAGKNIALQARGATRYTWINNIAGLSNTQGANPVAAPQSTTTYTVVGYDNHQCFTDTSMVVIRVNPMPFINHQPDVETLAGTPVQLQASGSADIITWSWWPADYLSCTHCAAPVITPFNTITYIATGSTQYGCTVADTIIVNLACAISHVYVPSVFSPNDDGMNDVFSIRGTGVKSIKWIRIFNRWGQIVFENNNSQVGDRSAGWDGRVKGEPASPGTYIYIAELTCSSGEVFPLKGTVTLVR